MAPIPVTTSDSTDSTIRDLDRLLERLDHTVLSEEADTKLLNSVYYRRKIGANVEHARTLLLRVERDVSTIKVQSRRQALTNDISTKRELIKQLNRRLIELDQQEEIDTSSSESEDTPSSFAPARNDTSSGIDLNPQAPLEEVSGLRSRKAPSQPTSQPDKASSTALFAGRKEETLLTRETILSQDQKTQDMISASLVGLAQALKASTIQFGQSLEGGKDVLENAVRGLDQNALGLEAAERRMGTLRRMTEGQGLLGRLKLYAIIAALWIGAFLIVFIGPKLRF